MTDETPRNEAEVIAEETPETEMVEESAEVADIVEAPIAEVEENTQPIAEAEADTSEVSATDEAPASISIEELNPAMELRGKVKSIELYGAFVDVGVGKDALLHISQLGKQNVRNVEDVVNVGEMITVYVLKADVDSGRIALSLEKPLEKPLSDLKVGDVITGKVVRIENFGAFIEIGAERPGMVHVSELSTDYINSPEDKVAIGDEVKVKIIKINKKRRQIDLSIKALEEQEQRQVIESVSADVSDEPMPTAMELALRRAMRDSDDEQTTNAEQQSRKQRNSRKQRRALNDALQRTLNNQDT